MKALPVFDEHDDLAATEGQGRAVLLVHLAERLYERERGKPPGSPDDLITSGALRRLPEGYTADPAPAPR